jgi:hypothetical protein
VVSCRLALVLVSGLVAACDAPRPPAVPPPTPQATVPAEVPLSAQQQIELAAQCQHKSADKFQRDWPARDGGPMAEYSAHYNRKLKSCFYVVTITDTRRSKTLIDVGENEIYGVYKGTVTADSPSGQVPDACQVEAMYCASEREWNVLVARYMETD